MWRANAIHEARSEGRCKMTDAEKQQLREDFEAWSGSEGPTSREKIGAYLENSCPFPIAQLYEQEAIDYLARLMVESRQPEVEVAYENAHSRAQGLVDHIRELLFDLPAPGSVAIDWSQVGDLNEVNKRLSSV